MFARELFKQRLEQSDTSTEWMKFYILWLLPISIVLGIISLLPYVSQSVALIRSNGFQWVVLVILAILIVSFALVLLTVYTYYQAVRLRPRGHKLLIIMFAIGIVNGVVMFIVKPYIGAVPSLAMSIPDLLGAGVAVLNLIYFRKRKHLFVPAEQTTVDESM